MSPATVQSDTQALHSSSEHGHSTTISRTSTRASTTKSDVSETGHSTTSTELASVTATQLKTSTAIPVISSTSTPQSSSKGASEGVVVAGVLAALAVLGLLMAAFFHFRERRRKSSKRRPVVGGELWDPRPFDQRPTVRFSTSPPPLKVDPDYPSMLEKDSTLSRNPSSTSTRSLQLHYKKSQIQLPRSASVRHYQKTVYTRQKSDAVGNGLSRTPSAKLSAIREVKSVHTVQDLANNESQMGIVLRSQVIDEVWDGRVRVNLDD